MSAPAVSSQPPKENKEHPTSSEPPKESKEHPISSQPPKEKEEHPISSQPPKESKEHPISSQPPKEKEEHPISSQPPKEKEEHPISSQPPKESKEHPTSSQRPKEGKEHPTSLQPPKESKEHSTSSQPPKKNKEHPIDVRLDRINDTILPTAPYLLGAECTLTAQYVQRAYHHTLNDWRKYTNFEPHEEKLQYMTFKDRSTDGSIVGLRARGGWDDGHGAIAPLEASSSRSSTDLSATAGPRKKITLAEYKNKARNKPPAKPSISDGVEVIKKAAEEIATMKNAVKPVPAEKQAVGTSQKRSADTMKGPEDTQSSIDHKQSTPPAKKLRTNPAGSASVLKEPQTHTSKEPTKDVSEGQHKPVSQAPATKGHSSMIKAETKQLSSQKPRVENGTSNDIAKSTPKPSNNAPPTIKLQKPTLPPMLSPLASDIEDKLAKLAPTVRKRSSSAVSGGPSSVSPNAKQPKIHAASTPSSGEKDRLKKATIPVSSTPTKGPQESKQITSAPRQGIQDVPKPAAPEGAKKLRLRVTLKIKKKYRKTLLQYLRMKPTPGKYPWGTLKSGEKRGRAQDDSSAHEPPAKRQKAPELEPRSTPMLRVVSGEGSVCTPQESTVLGTPNGLKRDKSPQAASLHPSKPEAKNTTTEDLKSEAKKYLALAKQLKYDSDAFFKNPEGMTNDEREKGVIIAIESVLCFMLAFRISDAHRDFIDRAGWNSILGLLAKAEMESKTFDHLFGFAHQLEGIIRDILLHVDLKALDTNPLADRFGNAKSADPNKTEDQNRASEYHRQFSGFCRLTDQSHKAWKSGLTSLGPAEMADKFPTTWAKRDHTKVPHGKVISQVVRPFQYKRSYWLPLSQMSTALEAINFGLDFLQEYCRAKGVDWKPKLVL